MHYNLEQINEMKGTLITLDDTALITDVSIQMDRSTARKLASVLRNKKVTRENQSLFFTQICFPQEALNIFTKGQSSMMKAGKRYAMTTESSTPLRFKGVMQTIVSGSDDLCYACRLVIGNMDFKVGDRLPEINGGIAVFQNIHARLYQYGRYQVDVLRDND